jgi:hypothetical protein
LTSQINIQEEEEKWAQKLSKNLIASSGALMQLDEERIYAYRVAIVIITFSNRA